MTTSATILLAHGSSDPNWLAPFQHLTDNIRQEMETTAHPVELAYMELAEPSLEHTVEQLVSTGITRIDVLPLFFATGRHLRRDVPKQIEALEATFPVHITLHPPVGLEPEVASAIRHVVTRQLNAL